MRKLRYTREDRMDDRDIVALYWSRDEQAVAETKEKYGKFCFSVAFHILDDAQDADEAVNDTYINAWNSMPPHRPDSLKAFIGKIARCAALKKRRDARASKRGGGAMTLAYEELSDCIPAGGGIEEGLEAEELTELINSFLMLLPETERQVFVLRYWYFYDVSRICDFCGFSQSKVKSMTARTRKKLRNYLEKEGIYVGK